ncbi:efflux RND transporter periplasmic adaptor subunit [Chitinophaga sancti]|uniref:Efflux RND transporter periplasmic adaptor subunit n=1 Tax=Chitinophaga sancti TaxID=1004 RepID=A0A1K1S4U6_9BACT|nr:efflux RND transporter periplasmic adaptor subunit [Chitinophaga sancti]WQD63748.1 efflux RND transporter periplasmic adaptor subunit [Chitinophaga sancti]WQG90627.1 efflux RND transporter periplasmic adaptor subunit [Chitinophaga sancti]SFW79095.1 RND family efflux transporter, MFP subunit [Chitinophaga sancti]
MKTKYIVSLVVILIIGLIVYKLAVNKKKLDEKNKPAPVTQVQIPVKVAVAKEQLLEINIIKTGNIAPFKEAKAVAMTAGTLTSVRFELGDQVRQEQVLAITDTRQAQLELQKAETDAAKLRNDLDTYTELLKGKAATQEKVNEIKNNYQTALNQVDQARKKMADAAIKAPTSGIISAKPVEQGVFVNGGTEIATIVNLSKAKVQVNLTEAEVYKVATGQKVKITTDVYPGKAFSGTISFISPQADQTHNYLVEIMTDNTTQSILRSGTFVYADFSKKTQEQLLVIPREALTESAKNAAVYIVKNNVARQQAIQTGNEMGGMMQVIGGLQAGDTVVTSGQINLKDGTPVSVSK